MLIQQVAPLRTNTVVNPMVAALVWAYYRTNLDKVILKVAFIKVRVRDLRLLFEAIAGPEPV